MRDLSARSLSRVSFYAVVTIPAAVLMALEIVSSRILAPDFGNSVYVWGSIIGVFLAVMSAGYWIGGLLADRHPHMPALGGLLVASAFFQALVLLAGTRLSDFLGEATGGSPAGVLLTTGLLFGPPTVFLAMVSPYAVKIATVDLGVLGGTAGRLYALSTVGSLAGTLGATFVLVPYLSLGPILSTLLVATVISAFLAIGSAWRRRLGTVVLAVSLLLLALLPEKLFRGADLEVLASRITPYQTLRVVETGGVRYLYGDGTAQAAIDMRDGSSELPYSHYVAGALLLQPDIEEVLVLGLGGGWIGTYLTRLSPRIRVDQVDVDPAIPQIASEFLGFDPGERQTVHVEDARRFLQRRPGKRWDFIYVDTYIGRSIPFHLTTREFFREVAKHLEPGGVLGVNSHHGDDSPFGRSLLGSIADAFRQIHLFAVPRGHWLILASNDDRRLDADDLLNRARELDSRFPDAEPTLPEIAATRRPLEMDLLEAEPLRDGYAPVNRLLFEEEDDNGENHGVPDDGVPDDGVPDDGVPDDGVPDEGE